MSYALKKIFKKQACSLLTSLTVLTLATRATSLTRATRATLATLCHAVIMSTHAATGNT